MMEKFNVTLSCLTQRIEEEQKIAGMLSKLEADILTVGASLSFRVQGRENLKNKLHQLAGEVDYYSAGMREMCSALFNVQSEYAKTERYICGQSDGSLIIKVGAGIVAAHAEIEAVHAEIDSEDSDETDWSLLWKAVGAAGPAGKAAGTVGQVITEDKDSISTWMKGASDAWSTVWKIADTVKTCKKDTSINWLEAAVGLNKSSSLKDLDKLKLSWSERAVYGKNQVFEKLREELGTTKGRVKQVGSTVFSLAVNAVSNYKEYETGAISWQRAVKETVMETAVDWGKNLLIDVVVTAGFAAVGITAPVLVVGAATAAVSVAVDWVSEKLCGKKLTEAVSDCILDGAGAVADWTVNTVKTGARKIKEGASAVWSGFTKGLKWLTGGRKLSFA